MLRPSLSRPSLPSLLGLPALIGSLILLPACGLLPQSSGPSDGLGGLAGLASSTATPAPLLDNSAFTEVLERFVDAEGLVDYRGLQQNPKALQAYVDQLAALPAASFASWSEAEQIAVLINA
ncbi:MAG: hypothetical protein N3Z28_00655, partial [Synechococcaceae cyanobacterium MAG-AL2]|nr:hypothetical protein [Candidatus Regnicoccus frigidus MAG-AL2]